MLPSLPVLPAHLDPLCQTCKVIQSGSDIQDENGITLLIIRSRVIINHIARCCRLFRCGFGGICIG